MPSSTHVNWGKLVGQGRVKAPGIPWSKEEQAALDAGMSVEDVRAGLLTPQAATEVEKTDKKLLTKMKKPELVKRAKELGLEFQEDAVTRADLILEIQQAEEKASDKA